MNDIMQVNQISKTMSSREIADSTNKDHSHVIRDIKLMLSQIDDPNMDDTDFKEIFDNRGYTSEIRLNKDLTFTLIAGYNSKVRYRIVKRWQELEAQVSASSPVTPALPNFTNPADAAIAWAEQYRAKEAAQAQLVIAQPKVNFYDTVAASGSLMTVSDVAKKMSMSAQALNAKLVNIGAYDRRRLPKKVFSHGFINRGYGEMKLTAEGHDRNLLTQAGQIYIIDLFSCKRELETV